MSANFIDGVARSGHPWSMVGTRFQVLCSDGQVRVATATAETDTMFSVPARVQVKGRTVAGFVTTRDPLFVYPGIIEPAQETFFQFIPSRQRKNSNVLPAWPKPQLGF